MEKEIQNLKFETKVYLPFEDNTLFNKTPLLVKVKKANEQDIVYLKENEDTIKRNEKSFEEYKNYTNIKKDFDFHKYLYHIYDIGNGTYTPYVYSTNEDLRRKIRNDFDCREFFFKLPTKGKRYLYNTEIVNNVLVFRFYVFSFENLKYKEGQNKGFYEVFRICFFKDNVWMEDRNEITNFDYEYIIYTKKIYNYSKFICENRKKTKADILSVYPYIKTVTVLGEYAQNNNDIAFKTFLFDFANLYKTKKVYKNIPTYIKEDLIKNNKRTKLSKKIIDEITNDNCSYMKYVYTKISTKQKQKEEEYFVLFSCFVNCVEVERIYITKDKIYIFGYNFFENKWVSTKKNKLQILNTHINNLLFSQNYKEEIVNKTLLKRTSFLKYTNLKFIENINQYNRNSAKIYPLNTPFTLLFLELNNSWIEQAIKMNFYNFLIENIHNANTDFIQKKLFFDEEKITYLKEQLTYFDKNSKTIKPLKKNKYFEECKNRNWKNNDSLINYLLSTKMATNIYSSLNLYEVFNVSPKMLKHIKDEEIISYEIFINRTSSDFYKKTFKEKDHNLWLKVCMLSIDEKSIRKVIKTLKQENKNICSFFVNLLKHDNPERLISRYLDYLKFRTKANEYGAFNYPIIISPSDIDFLHDRAFRDYTYVKQQERINRERTKKSKRLSMEEQFTKVVESEDYLQFVDDLENKNYSILPATNPNDLIEEGKNLSHCVGSYCYAMSKGKSYIYFLRKRETLDTAFYTLEITKTKNYKYNDSKTMNESNKDSKLEKGKRIKKEEKPYIYNLKQCYGYKDSIQKSRDCKSFIQDWAKRKNVKIGCKL